MHTSFQSGVTLFRPEASSIYLTMSKKKKKNVNSHSLGDREQQKILLISSLFNLHKGLRMFTHSKSVEFSVLASNINMAQLCYTSVQIVLYPSCSGARFRLCLRGRRGWGGGGGGRRGMRHRANWSRSTLWWAHWRSCGRRGSETLPWSSSQRNVSWWGGHAPRHGSQNQVSCNYM